MDGARVDIADGTIELVEGAPLPVPPDGHDDEPRLIASWLARAGARARLLESSGVWAQPASGGRAIASWSKRLARARAGTPA